MMSSTELQLQQIFRAVFNLDDDAPVADIAQGVTPTWDSLAHVTIITAVESEFDLEIEAADSLDLVSYDAVLRYLQNRSA